MSRFSPSIAAGPSWTQGLAEGASSLAQALIERRRFQQQQNQQDISNAENGVYRGQAPQGALTVNTPDYEIQDAPGGTGPQVVQTSSANAAYTGSRPVPGGLSMNGPLTSQLMAGRSASAPALPPSTTGTATFNGPDGKGLVDTSRYQQIQTPAGAQFYLDREQTPDAQALRRATMSGEIGYNRAITTQLLRNQGLLDRTDAVNDSYAPDGQRTQGGIVRDTSRLAGQGANQQAAITSRGDQTRQTEAGLYGAPPASGIGSKTQSYITEKNATYHPPAGRYGSSASDPSTKQFNAVTKQVAQTNAEINQTTRQLNSPATMMDSTQTSGLQQQLMVQQHRRDSLTNVADQFAAKMQSAPSGPQASPSGASTARHVTRSGVEASALPVPSSGARTARIGNVGDQRTTTVNDRLPAGPTSPSGPAQGSTGDVFAQEAAMYQKAVSDVQARPDLNALQKAAQLARVRSRYNERLTTIAKPKP